MRDLIFTPEETREADRCPHKLAKSVLVQQLKRLKENPEVCADWDFSKKENCNALLAYLIEGFFADFDFEAALYKYQNALNGARFSSYQFWCIAVQKYIENIDNTTPAVVYNMAVEADLIGTLQSGMRTYNAALWLFVTRYVKHFSHLNDIPPTLAELKKGLENERLLLQLAQLNLETLSKLDETDVLEQPQNFNLKQERFSFVGDFPVDDSSYTTGCPVLFVAQGLKKLKAYSQTLIELDEKEWEIHFGKKQSEVLASAS